MAQNNNLISDINIIPQRCRERFLPLEEKSLRPLRRLDVLAGGMSDLSWPYRIGRTCPEFHVAIWTLQGSARFLTPNGSGEFQPGSLWIGPAKQTYEYFVPNGKCWRVAWIHLADSPKWSDLSTNIPRSFTSEEGFRIGECMAACIAEKDRRKTESEKIIRHYSCIITSLLGRGIIQKKNVGELSRTQKLEGLWDEIRARPHHKWKLKNLAEKLHLSTMQFHRIVKEHTAKSPLEMVTYLRMQEAKSLLLHTDYCLKMIALRIGYETAFSFSRAFKEHEGISPSAFRRSKSSIVNAAVST